MPREKSADNLSDICVKNVAKNIDSYWLSDVDNDFGENPHLLYVIGPFEHLTECQLQKLIYTLSALKQLKRRHLQVIITNKFKNLDLSKSTIAANNGLVLKSVTYRCQKLTSLNITGCNFISANILADCLRNLPLLKHLQLSRTKTNDMVLSVIGDYCSNLLTLDVSGCVLTNKGADNLCQTYSKHEPKCSSLMKLNIQSTRIDVRGGKHIVQTFKGLCVFDFVESFEAVMSVIEEDFRNGVQTRQYKLSKLSCMSQAFQSIEKFKLVLKHCPHVTEFGIYCQASREYLLHLQELKFLQTLVICNDIVELRPFLEIKGNNLTSLAVNDVDDMNAAMLGRLCPNLHSLNIGVMSGSGNFESNIKNIYQKLETLTVIVKNNDEVFNPRNLTTILENSKKLKKLFLYNVQSFTDNVFKQILLFNPLQNLQEVCFEDCDSFTEDVLWEIVTRENNLYKITMNMCRQITQKNYESLKKFVKQNHLNLTIIYE